MRKIFMSALLSVIMFSNQLSAMGGMGGPKPAISEEMRLKLDFDYTVNLPILMRAVMNNAKNEDLNLTKEQITAVKKHKTDVMDSIEPVMKEAHELSMKLKHELLYGKISSQDAFKLAAKISSLKEQVLDMKITCILFVRETLGDEKFKKLLALDKNSMYKNYPYNY